MAAHGNTITIIGTRQFKRYLQRNGMVTPTPLHSAAITCVWPVELLRLVENNAANQGHSPEAWLTLLAAGAVQYQPGTPPPPAHPGARFNTSDATYLMRLRALKELRNKPTKIC